MESGESNMVAGNRHEALRRRGYPDPASQREAQAEADKIRIVAAKINGPELQEVLQLTPDQTARFEGWWRSRIGQLGAQFDVDTTESQKRMSLGMRIASTLGAFAICAAVVLFFMHYWGYLATEAQVAVLLATPLAALAATEFAWRREQTLYFTGLLAVVTIASFVLDLSALGSIFNIVSSEKAFLAWGAVAFLLAYRYGLRLLLVAGIACCMEYAAGAWMTIFGHPWSESFSRPEFVAFLGMIVFVTPFVAKHRRHRDFPPLFRTIGCVVCFASLLEIAESGGKSYLPWSDKTLEWVYEFTGLALAASLIALGIRKRWAGVVNTSAIFFGIFLFCRLYHWWWDWMPKYLFFASIGFIGMALVIGFKRLRMRGPVRDREDLTPAERVEA